MTALQIENRIALLESRDRENKNIVKKLRRKLRRCKETE